MTNGVVEIEELLRWNDMVAELKLLRKAEMELRRAIFKAAFPAPVEGTNNFNLTQGWVLKGQYTLERTVDEAALTTQLDEFRQAQIPDDIVVRKPSLAKRVYNTLNDDQRLLFDQCLVIKPGSPSMEIVLPAKNKPKAGDVKND